MSEWQLIKVDMSTLGVSQGAAKVLATLNAFVTGLEAIGFTRTMTNPSYISVDDTDTTKQITYYITMNSPTGAKLWLAYTGDGCQLHHSVFAYGTSGTLNSSNNPVYPTTSIDGTTTECGGWRGGLLTSWIPSGSNNVFETPNKTDSTWLPSDATRICGYLYTDTQAYTTVATMSTDATTGTNAIIYIFYKDDCFQVYNRGDSYAGNVSRSFPYLTGYICGKIFETVGENDSLPQSKFGWIELSHNIRDSQNCNGSNYHYGLWNFPAHVIDNTSLAYTQPGYFYRTYPSTKLASGQTAVLSISGGVGFFRPDGTIHNRNAGDCYYYMAPMHGIGNNNPFNAGVGKKYPLEEHWYPFEVGLLQYNKEVNLNYRPSSIWKGIIRDDLLRWYGACDVSPRESYHFGQILDSGNFVMGPAGCAYGFSKDINLANSPWHIQTGFTAGTEISFNDSSSNSYFYIPTQSLVHYGTLCYLTRKYDVDTWQTSSVVLLVLENGSVNAYTITTDTAWNTYLLSFDGYIHVFVYKDDESFNIYKYDSGTISLVASTSVSGLDFYDVGACTDEWGELQEWSDFGTAVVSTNTTIYFFNVYSSEAKFSWLTYDSVNGFSNVNTVLAPETLAYMVSYCCCNGNDFYIVGKYASQTSNYFYVSLTNEFISIFDEIKGLNIGWDQCVYLFSDQYVYKYDKYGRKLWQKALDVVSGGKIASITQNTTTGEFHVLVKLQQNYYYYIIDYNGHTTLKYTYNATGTMANSEISNVTNIGTTSYLTKQFGGSSSTINSLLPLTRSW